MTTTMTTTMMMMMMMMIIIIIIIMWPRWRSWYDSLRAGRSSDRNPVGARFSAPVQTGPEAHPASYTMGTGSFPGGKAAGAWR